MVQNGSSVPRKGMSSLLYDDLAMSASESLGRKVKIKTSSKGTGTISLAFKNEADLKTYWQNWKVNRHFSFPCNWGNMVAF